MEVILKTEGGLSRGQVLSDLMSSKLDDFEHEELIDANNVRPPVSSAHITDIVSRILLEYAKNPKMLKAGMDSYTIFNVDDYECLLVVYKDNSVFTAVITYNHDHTWRYIGIGFSGDRDTFEQVRERFDLTLKNGLLVGAPYSLVGVRQSPLPWFSTDYDIAYREWQAGYSNPMRALAMMYLALPASEHTGTSEKKALAFIKENVSHMAYNRLIQTHGDFTDAKQQVANHLELNCSRNK